jgi:hypothetical protein
MIPDPIERTIRIPVQWIDGQWQLFGGGKLPDIKPNMIADLLMPAFGLTKDEERLRWTAEETAPFLPSGSILFAQVSLNRVPKELRGKVLDKKHVAGFPNGFVSMTLATDAALLLTPGKKGVLLGGKVHIPAIDQHSDSINEALTKVSRAFEPNRKSSGGNVFLKVFVERDHGMVSLDKLRERVISIWALDAARPRDRCDSWLELGVSLSRVSEVWGHNDQKRRAEASSEEFIARPREIPKPQSSNELLEKATADYFDFRTRTLSDSDAGLIKLMDRFHDRSEVSEEIQKLRGFHEAMDRAVLNAYGWQDLALSARCEFLGPPGQTRDRYSFRTKEELKAVRLRWPDEFCEEVLRRLNSLLP